MPDERQRTPPEVAQNIQEFLDTMQPYEVSRLSSPVDDVYLYLPDLQMLVALVNAIAENQSRPQFLEAADRAAAGWRAANKRQGEMVSRLMDKFQKIRFVINGKDDAVSSAVREILDA
jgi:hypothetical protein